MSQRADQYHLFISACKGGAEGAIHRYQLDAGTAQLSRLNSTTDAENPFFIALSPDRRFLYAIHEPGKFGDGLNGQVAAYAIGEDNAQLTLLNRQPTQGSSSCYVAVDATGRSVLVANYGTGAVLSFPIGADGSLGDVVSFVQHRGASVDPARQQEPHAHCFVISPDNRHAYAADLGIDKIMNYRLDAATATLTPNRQPFARTAPGVGPRHFTFHPAQPWAYAINELASSVTQFDYDPQSGTLLEQQTITTLPAGYDGVSHCADLKITPDGRFLYGTNRGHDSIGAYAISEQGHLSLIGIEPSGGAQPQNLAITPDGALLLCANMAGNSVSLFHIDGETGRISPAAEPVSTPMPSCILIL